MSDEKKQEKKAAAPKGMSEATKKLESAHAKDGKRTVDEWMARHKSYTLGPKRGKLPRVKHPSWQHSCADVICGWSQHKHDANEVFRLTEDDYLRALKAAEGPPYKPPKGAQSKYCKIKHD
jgi:hypothetical protein